MRSAEFGGRSGAARPPVLVIVLSLAFLFLMASLVIGSLVTPEFPPYAPTVPAPQAVGDSLVGPATYTVDASATDRWRRFDFARNALVDSGAWDIAFRRFHLVAGAGAGILDLGPIPFDSVMELPAAGYVENAAAGDSSNPAVGKWYEYNFLTHLLTSKRHVYGVRTAAGRFAKLELLNYYCAVVGTGCITFRFTFQGDGSRRVARAAKSPRP